MNTTEFTPAPEQPAEVGQVQRTVGRLEPERAEVDALLKDPAYYEPRVAKTPLTPERSVADIPDAELLRRVVRSVARNRPRRKEFAWAAVSEAFGLGSTYSAQLCRRFGMDPDTGADLKAPNMNSQTS